MTNRQQVSELKWGQWETSLLNNEFSLSSGCQADCLVTSFFLSMTLLLTLILLASNVNKQMQSHIDQTNIECRLLLFDTAAGSILSHHCVSVFREVLSWQNSRDIINYFNLMMWHWDLTVALLTYMFFFWAVNRWDVANRLKVEQSRSAQPITKSKSIHCA